MTPLSDPKKPWLLDRVLAPASPNTGPVERLHRFFAHDVWLVRTEALPALPRALYRAARVAFLSLRGFLGDDCMQRASALTYITALSILPLLALAFSVLKGFGLYESLVNKEIEPYLDRTLGALSVAPGGVGVEGPELRVAVHEILTRVESTDFGGLGFIGLLIVLWAAMRLLGSIEGAFNKIWGVPQARSYVRRATDYLAIVIAVPIFLVVAIGITTAAESPAMQKLAHGRLGLDTLIELLLRSAPLVGGWMMFTFVYMVMPNARARFASVVLGGFVANVLWQIALYAHVRFQIGVANYNAFYAGFAAIPVFLVWVQLSWTIVLYGAEVAFAHEHEPAYRTLHSHQDLRPGAREVLALRAAQRITAGFLSGAERPTAASIAAELGVAPREVEGVLHELGAAGLVVAAEDPAAQSQVYVLARDPSSITLKHVVDALRGPKSGTASVPARAAADVALDRLLTRVEEESAGSAYNIDLGELVRRSQRSESEPQALEQPRVQPS